ncbi:MAG TPA: NAD(P)H-dependent oxidoreductase [Patescibacteria group bacterium]|jgi:NAD(P)H-dependent FMN reductase|nr:NAD(P)H-dependent oxidoreductase [Patescibacteria group bacterium]
MKLLVIIASTRPGRIGHKVGKWVVDYSKQNSDFEVEVADLAEINLPFLDAPVPPIMADGKYTNDHTTAWSKTVDSADAFVIVTPEYNYTMPPALVNAIDYLHKEWSYKPVGFVGYGVTGAVRAIQTEKLLLVGFNTMPISKGVELVGVYSPAMSDFTANEQHNKSASAMLQELHKWAKALAPLHQKLQA